MTKIKILQLFSGEVNPSVLLILCRRLINEENWTVTQMWLDLRFGTFVLFSKKHLLRYCNPSNLFYFIVEMFYDICKEYFSRHINLLFIFMTLTVAQVARS